MKVIYPKDSVTVFFSSDLHIKEIGTQWIHVSYHDVSCTFNKPYLGVIVLYMETAYDVATFLLKIQLIHFVNKSYLVIY